MSDEFNNSGSAGEVITQSTVSDKGKVPAALFCFFLGMLGIHRFYLGRYASAIVMLVMFIGGLFIPIVGWGLIIVEAFWEVIDFIRILCNSLVDSQGRKLR